MSEIELNTTICHYEDHQWIDWPITILYEWDFGVRINAIWQTNDPDSDIPMESLTKEQQGWVEQACIDDYAALCDAAEAARDDYGDWLRDCRRDDRLTGDA